MKLYQSPRKVMAGCLFYNMNRHLYRQILNENLYDNATNTYEHQRWIFQQENILQKNVRADLELKLPGRILSWPSYSPYLNPIENI